MLSVTVTLRPASSLLLRKGEFTEVAVKNLLCFIRKFLYVIGVPTRTILNFLRFPCVRNPDALNSSDMLLRQVGLLVNLHSPLRLLSTLIQLVGSTQFSLPRLAALRTNSRWTPERQRTFDQLRWEGCEVVTRVSVVSYLPHVTRIRTITVLVRVPPEVVTVVHVLGQVEGEPVAVR